MYVRVTAIPGARKEMIRATDENAFAISVREPAAHNHANNRIREILAQEYRVPIGKVRILTGHHSRSKMVSIDN